MKQVIQKSMLLLLLFSGLALRSYSFNRGSLQQIAIDFIAGNLDIFPDKDYGPIGRFQKLKNNNIFYTETRNNHLDVQRQNRALQIFDTLRSKPFLKDLVSRKPAYNIYDENQLSQARTVGKMYDLCFNFNCHDPFMDKKGNRYMIVDIHSNLYTARESEVIYLQFNKENKVTNFYLTYWIA